MKQILFYQGARKQTYLEDDLAEFYEETGEIMKRFLDIEKQYEKARTKIKNRIKTAEYKPIFEQYTRNVKQLNQAIWKINSMRIDMIDRFGTVIINTEQRADTNKYKDYFQKEEAI